ncbi:hypothetical protein EDB89DRAFT_1910124 [Lactarius sanguifluus]|nr:hypothetical protein EDB89DRAFT_1910124 [Lactarius sanguifluus]
MALTNPPLNLNLYMCAASLGSPMIALVLVPSDISQVNIFIRPPLQQVADAGATPRGALVEPTPPQGAIQPPGNTQKRLHDPMGDQTEHPPAKQAKVEAGPSRHQVTAYPQQVSGGDDLLVLPPIPRDIYDELISSYDLLASSYNVVNSLATEPKMSKDEQESRSRGRVVLVFVAIAVVVASGPGLGWDWGSMQLYRPPQQREEGKHNSTKGCAWCSSSSSPLRGAVTSGTVWIATRYSRETFPTLFESNSVSAGDLHAAPILPPQQTGPPLLRGQPSPYHQPRSPTPLTLEFYMQKGMSEEATELSSTSLKTAEVFVKVVIKLLYILSIATNEVK